MRRLGGLNASLARSRRRWDSLLGAVSRQETVAAPGTRLAGVADFGSNPGNLRMYAYVPDALPPSPALVVVLHGCTQTAAGYDHGTGWSTLADRYGFVLLYPEQKRANNPRTCFSWFRPSDTSRGRGEARSIRQMVDRMVRDHGIDRSRIFVTGLSAGGAMASAMLAVYPDVFAGGAIVAGLPYGAASTVQEAFESMFKGRIRPAREWGDLVRAASPHRGPWPRVSVWHGSADATVVPANAQEIVKQWADVHGHSLEEDERDIVDGYPRRVWRGPAGEALIEEYTITGMAHGTPLAPGASNDPHGAAGPFLLDVGIASSYHIAKFWGLTATTAERRPAARPAVSVSDRPSPAAPSRPSSLQPDRPSGDGGQRPAAAVRARFGLGIPAAIRKALRSAGLLGR